MSTSVGEVRRLAVPRAPALIRQVPGELWALGALVAIAAAIRIVTIDNQSFWMDEALTAYEAHLPFGAMINTVGHVETTPPLYFVLIWAWAHIFGTSEVALRSVSTLAGIALVPISYLAARDLISRAAGLFAGAFVAVNPFLIWYSQEARAYMLFAALSGASFLWFVRAQRDPSRRNLVWWSLFSALAIMTHFFAGFLVGAEAVWLLWVSRNRAVIGSVLVVAGAQAAMLPLAVVDTTHGPSWVSRIPWTHRVSTTVLEWGVSLLQRRGTWAEAIIVGAGLTAVVVLLLAFGGDGQTRRGAAVAGAIAAFVFLAPLALRFVGQDYFFSRNEIPAFVPLVIAISAACVAPRARMAGAVLALTLLAVFSIAAVYVQTHAFLQRPDWRRVAQALGPASAPRAILAADGTTADPLKIYLPGVDWVQPHRRKQEVAEIDVVGATKRLALSQGTHPLATASLGVPTLRGRPVPRSVAPPGSRLLERFRVKNWVIARFALAHPERVSINRLSALAPEFFRHTPAALLIFVQPAARNR
jgi:mannosyltransferase